MHAKDGRKHSPVGRGEKTFVTLFVVLNLTVPFIALEFYPFTTIPLFPSAPQFYCRYEVSDFEGQKLHPRLFGLHRSDWGGRRNWPAGRTYLHGFNTFGVVATTQELTDHLESVLEKSPHLPGVKVVQYIYGKKGLSVGLLDTRRLEIINPSHQPEARQPETYQPQAAGRAKE